MGNGTFAFGLQPGGTSRCGTEMVARESRSRSRCCGLRAGPVEACGSGGWGREGRVRERLLEFSECVRQGRASVGQDRQQAVGSAPPPSAIHRSVSQSVRGLWLQDF